MTVSITSMSSSITDALQGMIDRANLVPGYLDRVVYRQYQNAQRERWASENASADFMGGPWKPINPNSAYGRRKPREFADYPGGGTKLLIATQRLQTGVVGPSPDHQKIVDDRSIRVMTTVPYAHYVDEARTFTSWSQIFYSSVYGGLKDYLVKNIVRTAR